MSWLKQERFHNANRTKTPLHPNYDRQLGTTNTDFAQMWDNTRFQALIGK